MNTLLARFKILSGSVLKLVAMISMLIDHTAVILAAELDFMSVPILTIAGRKVTLYYIMRRLGRIAFPIFCFLITEGFCHSRSPKKYALRLLIFALMSEIPFDLMLSGRVFDPSNQNVYFTLLWGVLLLYIFEHAGNEIRKAVLMIAVMILAVFARADYGLNGAILILLIYLLKNHAAAQAVLAYPLLSSKVAFFSFLPINMYNGNRGFIKSNSLKFACYAFYPLHILILLMIRLILNP